MTKQQNGHHVVYIDNLNEAQSYLKEVKADAAGVALMKNKAIYRCFKIKDLSTIAANILKQEMLAKGGEAAVSRDTIVNQGKTDVLLMGSLKHYHLLLKKLKMQPFGLKILAAELEAMLTALQERSWCIESARGKLLKLGSETKIMAILNVTPDSFYDGGRYFDLEAAYRRAEELMEQGADIIDLGAASSRPNSQMVDEEEELRRLIPLVKRLSQKKVFLSIDSFRARVAEAALAEGADMVNDISRLQLDKDLIKVLLKYQAPVVLMHNRMQIMKGQAYLDLIAELVAELNTSIMEAKQAGLKADKIIIDPGIGFGKTCEENLRLIKRLDNLKSLPYPILLGASRKSFIGQTLNLEVEERLEGSLAIAAAAIMKGAQILRVHDVKASKRLALMLDAVKNVDG